jgi:hypothetical protein
VLLVPVWHLETTAMTVTRTSLCPPRVLKSCVFKFRYKNFVYCFLVSSLFHVSQFHFYVAFKYVVLSSIVVKISSIFIFLFHLETKLDISADMRSDLQLFGMQLPKI